MTKKSRIFFRDFWFLSIFLFFISPLLSMAEVKSIQEGDSRPIVIGLDADFSAVAIEGGVAIERGALIAIHEINQSGGLLGRQLELKTLDHRGNPSRGLDNIQSLSQIDNLVAVLSGVHTPVVLNELKLIHEKKIPFLIPWAAGTPIIDNGYEPNYVFRLSVRDEFAGGFLINNVKKRGFKKVALLLEKTGWGRSNEKSMLMASVSQHIEITGTHWFHWGTKDFSSEIDEIINSGAQAIMMVANAPEGADIIKSMVAQPESRRLPIISHWGITGGDFVQRANKDNLSKIDLVFLQTFSFLKEGVNNERLEYVFDQYRFHFDSESTLASIPSAVGVAHAYDLVHLLALAIEQAGSIDRTIIRNHLEKIDNYQGLVKNYLQPFSVNQHEALNKSDYILARYNEKGEIVPIDNYLNLTQYE